MSRQYRHIEQYAEEILRLKAEGKTRAEIGAKLGFSKEKVTAELQLYSDQGFQYTSAARRGPFCASRK